MRMRSFSNAMVLLSCLLLITACGGDASSSSDDSGGGGGGGGGGTTSGTPVTSTAVLHAGRTGGEALYHVLNTALSVLDENGDPIDNLDGGDFRVIASANDYEGHHRAQKMDFLTQVTGHLYLMLDTSNDMASRFTELQTAAKRLVSQAVAIGLPVTVYEFNIAGSVDPVTPVLVGGIVATDVASAATVNTAIDALTPQLGNTFFYESIAAIVNLQVSSNLTTYNHATPAVAPTSYVEMMVIMSDGLESPGTGNSSSDVTSLSDGAFWIHSIAVGDNPDTAALESISTFPITTVPDGGTYSDAVDSAMTFIENYYNGFYLVEYQVTDLMSATESYDIKLFDNDNTSVTVGPFDATLLPATWLPAVCCEVWAGPGFAVDAAAVTLNATTGDTMDFQVVQLWSNITDTGTSVTWTLTNADGELTGAIDSADPTVYTITSNGNTSTGSLNVDVGGVWNQAIPITVP